MYVLFLSLADVGRSIQAWQQHGRPPHSELPRSQRDSEGGSTLPLAGVRSSFGSNVNRYYIIIILALFSSRRHFAVLLIGHRPRFIYKSG